MKDFKFDFVNASAKTKVCALVSRFSFMGKLKGMGGVQYPKTVAWVMDGKIAVTNGLCFVYWDASQYLVGVPKGVVAWCDAKDFGKGIYHGLDIDDSSNSAEVESLRTEDPMMNVGYMLCTRYMRGDVQPIQPLVQCCFDGYGTFAHLVGRDGLFIFKGDSIFIIDKEDDTELDFRAEYAGERIASGDVVLPWWLMGEVLKMDRRPVIGRYGSLYTVELEYKGVDCIVYTTEMKRDFLERV